MKLSANFHNDLSGRPFMRARFQFVASGTEQSGVLYVTRALGADPMRDAAQAAKVAARRAGCDVGDVTLFRIMEPAG